jgi:DedD protein
VKFDNDLHDSDPQEREISLGTATILGIFLALALVCAAFFGFGYSLGRHSNAAAPATASEPKSDTTDKDGSPFSDFKSPAKTRSADDSTAADVPAPDSAPVKTAAPPAPAPDTAKTAHAVAFPVPTQPAPAAPATVATGQFLVQVSATSREGDAESLIAALKQKGYTATIRQEQQDKLFHVQIGPFATKIDADTMRKRLDTDGYKAIVK